MLLELRVARAWQVPPTKLRDWTQEDRVMAAALLVHEADIGPCGQPHRATTDPDLLGWVAVNQDADGNETPAKVCAYCAAAEQYAKDHPPDKREPGELAQFVDNRHLMTRREEGGP